MSSDAGLAARLQTLEAEHETLKKNDQDKGDRINLLTQTLANLTQRLEKMEAQGSAGVRVPQLQIPTTASAAQPRSSSPSRLVTGRNASPRRAAPDRSFQAPTTPMRSPGRSAAPSQRTLASPRRSATVDRLSQPSPRWKEAHHSNRAKIKDGTAVAIADTNGFGFASAGSSPRSPGAPSGNLLEDNDITNDQVKFKPLKGMVFPPSDVNDVYNRADFSKAPLDTLELEFVHGFRGHDCRANLRFLPGDSRRCVYFAAAVGIVYDIDTHTQKFFRGYHTDDIQCLAIHPNPKEKMVATGQIGKRPLIFLWNFDTMEPLKQIGSADTAIKNACFHQRGIVALDFGKSGDYLISVGNDNDHVIAVWSLFEDVSAKELEWNSVNGNGDMPKQRLRELPVRVSDAKGHNDPILCLDYHHDQDCVVSCGVNHIKFWNLQKDIVGGAEVDKLKCRKGVMSSKKAGANLGGKIQTMYCTAFLPDQHVLSGAEDGSVYVWEGNTLIHNNRNAHKGPCTAIGVHSQGGLPGDGRYCTGGGHGTVRIWSVDHQEVKTVSLKDPQMEGSDSLTEGSDPKIVSLDWLDFTILVGTAGNEIYRVDEPTGKVTRLISGHFGAPMYPVGTQRELWGLAPQPGYSTFATCSGDGTLKIWDILGKTLSKVKKLTSRGAGGRIVQEQGRSLDFSGLKTAENPSQHMAVGLSKGGVMILDSETLEEVREMIKDRKEEISDVKFSPDNRYLAIASHDNFIDVYDVSQNYKRVGVCVGHSSYVTHVDWSNDSATLRSTCGAYELLYWEAETCHQITFPSSVKDTVFETNTCILGYRVWGMWSRDIKDGTDINACSRSQDRTMLICATDHGDLKLYPYPCLPKKVKYEQFGHVIERPNLGITVDRHAESAESHCYKGHSSHVTNCCFTHNDTHVISVGGAESSIMQWKHKWADQWGLEERGWSQKRIQDKFDSVAGPGVPSYTPIS